MAQKTTAPALLDARSQALLVEKYVQDALDKRRAELRKIWALYSPRIAALDTELATVDRLIEQARRTATKESQRCATKSYRRAMRQFRDHRHKWSRLRRERRIYIRRINAARQAFDAARQQFYAVREALRTAKMLYRDGDGLSLFRYSRSTAQRLCRQITCDKRYRMRQAGVPRQFVNAVRISKNADETMHLYFGGIGAPGGKGHAHYVIDPQGVLLYKRDPSAARGLQNFTWEGMQRYMSSFP